jgi:hypothetical protein
MIGPTLSGGASFQLSVIPTSGRPARRDIHRSITNDRCCAQNNAVKLDDDEAVVQLWDTVGQERL